MTAPVWPRPLFQRSDAPWAAPSIAFVVFGAFGDRTIELSRSRHRVAGAPEGVVAERLAASEFADILAAPPLEAAHAGDALRTAARDAPEAMLIHGAPPDSADLAYLRDTVGLVVATLEIAGDDAVVLDLNAMRLHTPEEWRRRAWEPPNGDPFAFTHILSADTPDGELLSTRGMRTFGRPDVWFPAVQPGFRETALDTLRRLILAQAHGHLVADDEPVAVPGLPEGLVARTVADGEGSYGLLIATPARTLH